MAYRFSSTFSKATVERHVADNYRLLAEHLTDQGDRLCRGVCFVHVTGAVVTYRKRLMDRQVPGVETRSRKTRPVLGPGP